MQSMCKHKHNLHDSHAEHVFAMAPSSAYILSHSYRLNALHSATLLCNAFKIESLVDQYVLADEMKVNVGCAHMHAYRSTGKKNNCWFNNTLCHVYCSHGHDKGAK